MLVSDHRARDETLERRRYARDRRRYGTEEAHRRHYLEQLLVIAALLPVESLELSQENAHQHVLVLQVVLAKS